MNQHHCPALAPVTAADNTLAETTPAAETLEQTQFQAITAEAFPAAAVNVNF